MHDAIGAWSDTNGTAADAGRCAGLAVDRAIELAQAGEVDGIVTAPLDKHALLAGGYDFPGHTELLAARTGCSVAMMLAATRPSAGSPNPLRVVLATTHIALRDVPRLLTAAVIVTAFAAVAKIAAGPRAAAATGVIGTLIAVVLLIQLG